MAVLVLPPVPASRHGQRREKRCVTFRDEPCFGSCGDAKSPAPCTIPIPFRHSRHSAELAYAEQTVLHERHAHGGRPAMRRNHTADPAVRAHEESAASVSTMSAQAKRGRARSQGSERSVHVAASVVAPGGGTACNAPAFAALGRKERITLNIAGQSRAVYDCYPPTWVDGVAPPNLESFALDLVEQGLIEDSDCLIVGSRGGQVVLPTLWRARGEDVPPAVVINGGCAMDLPTPVRWPENVVTFLLLGGQDYFKGHLDMDSYVHDTQCRVPKRNSTTAILLVNEMGHMPQTELLIAILHRMIYAVTEWSATNKIPHDEFDAIITSLILGGWSGQLVYKVGPHSKAWHGDAFP